MKKHNKIVAIQGDPIQKIIAKTDTTILLALEAQKRKYKIYYYETKNLTFLKLNTSWMWMKMEGFCLAQINFPN